MVGMGAVAWSSLRDLESASNLQGHANSPIPIFSPEGKSQILRQLAGLFCLDKQIGGKRL